MGPTSQNRRGLAAFDFDGTITRRDSLMGFLVAVGGLSRVGGALVTQGPQLLRGRTDDTARDNAKEAVVGGVLRGTALHELRTAGRRYADRLPERFRSDAVAHIDRHRRSGHRMVIVSASLIYYLEPVAERLGFDGVIGVELEFDEESICTGRLAGPNVRGPEKQRRLTEWIGADLPSTELWAYGNSAGDDELLAMADHPVWMGGRADRNGGD